jgi:hypothetical protein
MKFKTGNAAFEDYAEQEVSRILKEIADKVENGSTDGKIRDINGNTIGEWDLDI